jgi:hypothetical protein
MMIANKEDEATNCHFVTHHIQQVNLYENDFGQIKVSHKNKIKNETKYQ